MANHAPELFVGTQQRYRLEVPTPLTRLVAGLYYDTTNHSGISLHTVEHVRFFAKGTVATSDIVAQATGQLWLQSLKKMVAFAEKDILVASPTSTTFAAEGGITIMSGFGPGPIASETTPDTFPAGIESYENTAALVTGIWVIFDTFMALTITAVTVFLTLMDGSLDKWGYEGAAANLAGAAVNLAGLSFIPWSSSVSLPGINLFSQAGTLIGAEMGAVTIVGLPGTLVASTFTTQFGVITAGVRGIFSCGMNALGPVDVTALADVTVRSHGETTVACRTGTTSMRAPDLIIGTEINPWVLLPQMPTREVEMVAVQTIDVSSKLLLGLDAKKGFKSSAGADTTFEATQKALFKSAPFQIEVIPASVELGQAAGPSIKIDDTGVTLTGPAKATEGKMGPGNVELSAGSAKIKVAPGASLTVDGVKFDLQ